MLMKIFPLRPYCALALRLVGSRAMAGCHVQLVHNALIGIQTLNLRITSTMHYAIEPLTLNTELLEASFTW